MEPFKPELRAASCVSRFLCRIASVGPPGWLVPPLFALLKSFSLGGFVESSARFGSKGIWSLTLSSEDSSVLAKQFLASNL